MSDLDRDKLYTSPTDGSNSGDSVSNDVDSDDSELELEPPDPEIAAAAERRSAEAINAHLTAIDINEVYRDLDANRDTEIVAEWSQRLRNFRFQFQIRHLLILTAVVAMILALRQWINLGTALIVGIMLAVAGVSLYLKLEENKRQEAADRRRRKLYAQRRAEQLRRSGQPVKEDWDEEPLATRPAEVASAPTPPREFHFQFSMSQMLAVITVAAVLLGLGGAIGGASSLATICGLAALAGLIVPALGLQPPDFVVFAWWMLLLLFVALSLFSAIWTAFTAG
jgi:hypothetical protein